MYPSAECEQLEKELHSDKHLPIDVIHDEISSTELQAIRSAMLAIGQFFKPNSAIERTFKKYFTDARNGRQQEGDVKERGNILEPDYAH